MYVNMVFVDANFLDIYVREKFPKFLRDQRLEICIYAFHQDFSPVSRDPDYVVLRLVYRMCLLH